MPVPPIAPTDTPQAHDLAGLQSKQLGLEKSVADIAGIIATTDRLAQLGDGDRLTREAVEFARESLGLERVSIYLSRPEPTRVVMRGTWGTNDRGRTTDERSMAHACTREDFEALRHMHQQGVLWQYCNLAEQQSPESPAECRKETRSWLAVTPLIVAADVVGVIYNDTAISSSPIDVSKQTNLALFGSLLANISASRWGARDSDVHLVTASKNSRLIRKVLGVLEEDPQKSGETIAKQFGISPGHLARTFKLEVGTSLVEYRNRIRLDRFFTLVQSGHRNLLEAALEAGFGSYAQFHRVHRRVTGSAPRQYVPLAVTGASGNR